MRGFKPLAMDPRPDRGEDRDADLGQVNQISRGRKPLAMGRAPVGARMMDLGLGVLESFDAPGTRGTGRLLHWGPFGVVMLCASVRRSWSFVFFQRFQAW